MHYKFKSCNALTLLILCCCLACNSVRQLIKSIEKVAVFWIVIFKDTSNVGKGEAATST